MGSKIVLMGAVAIAGSLACQVAAAQAASSPSRADVKAETAAAAKTGEMGAGVHGGPKPKTTGTSTMTREERKKTTAEASKTGEMGAGVHGGPKPKSTGTSTTTRAERKKSTAEANKKGELAPAGDTNKP